MARLRAEPGIVVTQSEARDGKFMLSGFRDPLAVDPLKLLGEAGIDPARVEAHFDPYQGPRPAIRARAAAGFPQPASRRDLHSRRRPHRGARRGPVTVDLARSHGRPLAAGRSACFRRVGHSRYQRRGLGNLRDTIQARSILFDNGVSLPTAGQDTVLDQIAGELKELATMSSTCMSSPGSR